MKNSCMKKIILKNPGSLTPSSDYTLQPAASYMSSYAFRPAVDVEPLEKHIKKTISIVSLWTEAAEL
jgi:hypothetical protein